jgi:hypothetical protein
MSVRTFMLAVVNSVGRKRPAMVILHLQPFAVPERTREIKGTGRPFFCGEEVGQVGSRERGRGCGGVRGLGNGLD